MTGIKRVDYRCPFCGTPFESPEARDYHVAAYHSNTDQLRPQVWQIELNEVLKK